MRSMNVPELLDPRDSRPDSLVWDVMSEVYPDKVAGGLVIQNEPDPFSNSPDRMCHHAAAHFAGLGVVDFGWTVTGEPPPSFIVAAILVDPHWWTNAVRSYTATTAFRPHHGKGIVNHSWRALNCIVQLTLLGLAVRLVESSTHHRATCHFIEMSQSAEYHENGMMRRWLAFSKYDLLTMIG